MINDEPHRLLELVSTEQLKELAKSIRVELAFRRRKVTGKDKGVLSYDMPEPNGKIKEREGALPVLSKIKNKMAYLKIVLDQDWDYLFSETGNDDKNFYVYAHQDPRKSIHFNEVYPTLNHAPFYIGKGCGLRYKDLKRNQGHGKRIADIIGAGADVNNIPVMLKKNLGEKDALVLESKLIYIFGTLYDGVGGMLVNLDIGKRPNFSRVIPNRVGRHIIIRKNKEKKE